MKKWTSAGGLVIAREEGGIWVALLKDWKDRWIIPKGRIEPGETLGACAIREAREELGLDVTLPLTIIAKLHLQRLFFRLPKDPELQFKIVHVYLMELPRRTSLHHQVAEHFTGAEWLPLDEAERIAYRQAEVFAAARRHLLPTAGKRRRRHGRRGKKDGVQTPSDVRVVSDTTPGGIAGEA